MSSTKRTDLTPGSIWVHRRDTSRRVTVTETRVRADGSLDVFVDRNTSRRKQAIKETTLRREYQWAAWVPGRPK